MAQLATAVLGAFGVGSGAAAAGTAAAGTAGTAAAAGGAATAAATSGMTLNSILQGVATVFSVGNTLAAGNAQGESYDLAAEDAARQQPLETLQGIAARTSIKAQMADAIGEMDTANAAGGVDLSFGSPVEARRQAFREGDKAINTEVATEQSRQNRLTERQVYYRKMAKKARRAAGFEAFGQIFDTGMAIKNRV
ncbi:hypothetical protein [Martelella sp. FOR1707]